MQVSCKFKQYRVQSTYYTAEYGVRTAAGSVALLYVALPDKSSATTALPVGMVSDKRADLRKP